MATKRKTKKHYRRKHSSPKAKAARSRLSQAAKYCSRNRGKQKQSTCVKDWFKKH